jgi:hypothetical protein
MRAFSRRSFALGIGTSRFEAQGRTMQSASNRDLGSRRRGSLIYTSFCRYGLSEDHIATTPHDITGSGSPPSVWTTTPPGSPTWPGSLMTLGNQPTICSRTTRSPRPEESHRRRLRLRRADARRHGRGLRIGKGDGLFLKSVTEQAYRRSHALPSAARLSLSMADFLPV